VLEGLLRHFYVVQRVGDLTTGFTYMTTPDLVI